jgi:hypothetical protein
MEVRQVMRPPNFHVHANDDSKKTAEFWHRVIPIPVNRRKDLVVNRFLMATRNGYRMPATED